METKDITNAEEFYKQQMFDIPALDSCLAGTIGITYSSGEIDQEEIHAKDEMIAFAEAYHQSQSKQMQQRIKELEDELQSLKENPICVHCEKYRTSQGDGLIHQLCECNLNGLNPKTEKCKCEFPLVRNDGKEYCGTCNENI